MAKKDIQSKEQKNGSEKKHRKNLNKNLFSFFNSFKSELDCVDFIKKVLYPNGVVSPYTWERTSRAILESNHLTDYRCTYTNNNFSIFRGTIFSNTKVDLRTWLFVIYDMAASQHGLTAPEVAGKYGVTERTAQRMIRLVQSCMSRAFRNMKLSGLVDVDEKYYGGDEKNRSYHKKLLNPLRDGKIPVIGIAEKRDIDSESKETIRSRRVRLVVLDPHNYPGGADGRIIRELTGKCTTDDCMYFTDSSGMYDWMDDDNGVLHRNSCHQNGKYSLDGEDSNTIEGYFGWIFPAITGIHRFPSRIHLQRYLDTMCFLSNTRDMSVYERFMLILKHTRLNIAGMQVSKKHYWLNEDGTRKQGRPVELVNKEYRKEVA